MEEEFYVVIAYYSVTSGKADRVYVFPDSQKAGKFALRRISELGIEHVKLSRTRRAV